MGGGGSTNERAEKEREAASATRHEIRKLLEEYNALIRAMEKREAASAKRREIREKEIKEEHEALMRTEEEKREAASAKRREIKEKELKEKRLALERAEKEKREAASAKRREIKEKDVKERLALMRGHLWIREHGPNILREYVLIHEPGPNIPPWAMEKEQEAAKRREIKEKELKEHHALMWEHLRPYEHRPHLLLSSLTMSESEEEEEVKTHLFEEDERQRAGSPAPSCLSMKSDRSRDSPPLFSDEPGPPDTQDPGTEVNSIFSLLRENIVDFVDNELNKFRRFLTNVPEGLESQGEYEEGLNAKEEVQRRGSREGLLKITLDFLRMNQEELADSNERRPFSIPEEGRAGSPASSSESTMSNRSMTLPVSVNRTEEDREDPSALRRETMELVSMEESMALIREDFLIRDILLSERSMGIIPEEEEAGSPAPSGDSMKSDRSKD